MQITGSLKVMDSRYGQLNKLKMYTINNRYNPKAQDAVFKFRPMPLGPYEISLIDGKSKAVYVYKINVKVFFNFPVDIKAQNLPSSYFLCDSNSRCWLSQMNAVQTRPYKITYAFFYQF